MFSAFRSAPSAARPSVTEVAELVAEERMILIDVREVAEAKASGVAKGARLIPLSLLGLKADPKHSDCELPHGLPIAVYCASGGRSGMAADVLTRLGYGPVHNLGGLRDWAAGGGAVVAY
ncbi:rhodanese-like domain-containing protein [Rhodobacter sp. SY28-1]|uniref:rhodanese-like domain-containing protein n=1 Tax=Rhodobacter sp. SY28-1 TaxID=2562317 RepID=UPI0010C0A67B|nr:rhodanese-like domain-containing protein [Rhodobacter sp. SY28-1]